MSQTQVVRGVATSIREEDGMTCVRYHNTDVVKFNDKEIILNSDGWRTNTTRTRMHQAASQFRLGFRVYQKDYKWFVDFNNLTLEYTDKMSINRLSGEVA